MLRRIAIIICIIILLVSAISLVTIYTSPKSNAELYNVEELMETIEASDTTTTNTTEPASEFVSTVTNTSTETTVSETKNLYAWQQLNEKVSGTITVTNLKSEPIVSTENQNEYLYSDIKGNYNQNGTLFTAAESILGKSKVTCIFGHNMDNGAMFGQLDSYTDINYLKENPSFEITTNDGSFNCKIVGVMFASADYNRNDWYYPQPELTEKEFETFRFQVRSRSLYAIEDEFDYNSNYIMLSTCSYGSTNERLVVVARICNDTTDYNVQNNPLVLYTKEYYKEYGISEPSQNALKENYMTYYS